MAKNEQGTVASLEDQDKNEEEKVKNPQDELVNEQVQGNYDASSISVLKVWKLSVSDLVCTSVQPDQEVCTTPSGKSSTTQ